MENFKKLAYVVENENIVLKGGEKLMPHSLVILNEKGTLYNVVAKIRNTDKFTVARAYAKALLTDLRAVYCANNNDDARESGNTAKRKLVGTLGGYILMVTDKNGELIQETKLIAYSGKNTYGKLRDAFSIRKTQPIYQLFVEQGKDWSDEKAALQLKAWCNQAVNLLDYVKNLDEALGRAADSNEREHDANNHTKEESMDKDSKYRKLLGVSENATLDEIRKAYRNAVIENHPDNGGDTEKMQSINEAYEALKNVA